ncbi:M23 family metallopeptidase [Actinomycetota bacterium]
MSEPVLLRFPFTGRWRTENSPADRVPSHGTDAFGTRYAVDFVAVDEHGRSGPRSWRTHLATEPPETFLGFGASILSPGDGQVVDVHAGEPDHAGRRSPLTLTAYLLTQGRRARGGADALAGNHISIELGAGRIVTLCHLRRGSVTVRTGQQVSVGEPIGQCGNSGNSTEPHVHVQVNNGLDLATGRALPMAFVGGGGPQTGWMPRGREIVHIPEGR